MRTLIAPAPLRPGTVVLTGAEAHHGRSVLRLAPGDRVRLFDGAGRHAVATVTAVDKRALHCALAEVASVAPGAMQRLRILVAAPKGPRFEDMVRPLTELGVGEIGPLRCARSVREPRLDRARRIAVEASKQCRRVWLPAIGPVVDFATLAKPEGRFILLDPDGVAVDPGPPQETTLVIGPEGGFTADERAHLGSLGARPVRIARPVLRIETAAVAAAAIWSHAWERHEQG